MAKDMELAYVELGSTGLNRYGGFIVEEFLPELTGQKALKVYRQMRDNDPTVGALLFAIRMLIRQVEWKVAPASDDPGDQEVADFVETCRHDMSDPWGQVIDEILFSMLPFGHAPHEIIYKLRYGDSLDPRFKSKYADGRIGWRKLPIRAPETIFQWIFDEKGGLQGLEQQAPPSYQLVRLPIEKILLFRPSVSKGNPEGTSILRSAYRSWYFKSRIENIEGIGIERDLAGLPIAEVPAELLDPNASADKKQLLASIKKMVTNIRRDEQEGVVFPLVYDENGKEAYRLKLLSTGGQRSFDVDKVINRYDQRILMTVMADFLMLGHEKVGSFALASSKTELFALAIGAWMDAISGVFNQYGFPRLLEMNGIDKRRTPKLVHGDLEKVDLDTVGNYIQRLSASGMPLFPNPDLEQFLLRQIGAEKA